MQALEGRSDREACRALQTDIAWKAAAGLALTDEAFCLGLARRLAEAKVRAQLSCLLRGAREADAADKEKLVQAISRIRKLLGPLARAANLHSLRGYEGSVGAQYFGVLPSLIADEAGVIHSIKYIERIHFHAERWRFVLLRLGQAKLARPTQV